MKPRSPHTFHIPIMGTGFTIDAALRVVKYGISVVGHSDWILLEPVRQFHCERLGEPFEPIGLKETDAGPRRIQAWLDLVDRVVHRESQALQAAPFEPGSEITRYFEMCPPGPVRSEYEAMLATTDPADRKAREDALRPKAVPGEIQFNVMTKVDGALQHGRKTNKADTTSVLTTLGFAWSTVDGSIVYSAGMNPRLYGRLADMPEFREGPDGELRKRIILKVSDFRSAEIQAKYLARRGLWVSEYRVESGLNCGGHAFPAQGKLMGPILEEFKERRAELTQRLLGVYNKALVERGRPEIPVAHEIIVTVQGGIGTADENRLLLDHYEVDETGWATPFLLVPEVTNVDPVTRQQLVEAGEDDVHLSGSSPLGIPFWNLRASASERARERRIAEGKPGSECPRWWLKLFNTEFTYKPICTASHAYQVRKLAALETEGHSPERLEKLRNIVLAKSCICTDLAASAEAVLGLNEDAAPAICPGPNIVNFAKIATLDEMVGHIYGRGSLISNPDRPHMFVREAELNCDLLRDELEASADDIAPREPEYFEKFVANLRDGLAYYVSEAEQLFGSMVCVAREALAGLRERVDALAGVVPSASPTG